MHNEDKLGWCKKGETQELAFIEQNSPEGVRVSLNPLKETNPFVHDFEALFPCDLKTCETPWKYSSSMFGIDPAHAVSINQKDIVRYRQLYPNIIIIFDVKYPDYTATHYTDLKRLEDGVLNGSLREHVYKNRVHDTKGNAKVSYVFDITELPLLHQTTTVQGER